LGLFGEEKDLFPSELVSPHVGIGWGNSSGPKYVVSYQLNVNDCPHLSAGNVCKIYDRRPLVCRAFPLRLGQERDTQIASACAFVEEVGKRVDSLSGSQLAKLRVMSGKELRAIDAMNRLIDKPLVEHPVDARVIWVFDLRSKAWHVARVDI
jgi:Fe-S-cluster containining protein